MEGNDVTRNGWMDRCKTWICEQENAYKFEFKIMCESVNEIKIRHGYCFQALRVGHKVPRWKPRCDVNECRPYRCTGLEGWRGGVCCKRFAAASIAEPRWRVRGLPLTCLLRTEYDEESQDRLCRTCANICVFASPEQIRNEKTKSVAAASSQENRILPAYVHLLKQRTVRPFAPKLFETLPMVLHSRLKDRSAIFHLPKTGWAHQCTQQPLSFTWAGQDHSDSGAGAPGALCFRQPPPLRLVPLCCGRYSSPAFWRHCQGHWTRWNQSPSNVKASLEKRTRSLTWPGRTTWYMLNEPLQDWGDWVSILHHVNCRFRPYDVGRARTQLIPCERLRISAASCNPQWP